MKSFIRSMGGAMLLLSATVSWSASPDQSNRYQRVICVVPIVGSGTLQDPKRPMFTPSMGNPSGPVESAPKRTKGFTEEPHLSGYQSVLSDDGGTAIVEFVARDRAAFKPLFEASRAHTITLYKPNQVSTDELVRDLQKVRKTFSLHMFRVGSL